MKKLLLGTALAAMGAVGSAQANTLFTADFSGGGAVYNTSTGTQTDFSFTNEGSAIDDARIVNNDEGVEGGIHVRAFGEFLDDNTYSFVNSAMAQGDSFSFAETVISLEFTNTGSLAQQITLNSTFIPGALGVYFADNCQFESEGDDDLFGCPQAPTERLLADGSNYASTALDVDVLVDGERTDGFDLSLESFGTGFGQAFGEEPRIVTDFDDASQLNGFGRLNPDDPILDSVFYKWDETMIEFSAGIADPGETVSIQVVFTSLVEVLDDTFGFSGCDVCLSTFMGFGDPIGSGSDDNEEGTFRFERFESNFSGMIEIEGVFSDPVSPVPVPGAVWLMGAGVAGLAARARKNRR